MDSYISEFPLNLETEKKIIKELKDFNSKFGFVKTIDIKEIKEFLKENYKFVKEKINYKISLISNYQLLKKFCEEYSKTAIIFMIKNERISENFYGSNYRYREQYYRRILKYIIENIAVYISNKGESNKKNDNAIIFTEVIVLLEEFLRICGDIDLTNIYETDIELKNNYNLEYGNFYSFSTPLAIVSDKAEYNNKEFYTDSDLYFEHNAPKVFSKDIKDSAFQLFENLYNVSYESFEKFCISFIEKGKWVYQFKKEELFNELINEFNISKNIAENLYQNLSLDISQYKAEIYNPKRSERLYKKIFIPCNEYIFFIPILASENIGIILDSLFYNIEPFKLNKKDKRELTTVSNLVGASFEKIVKDIFEKYNFFTFLNIKKYNDGNENINLNDKCGEIDIIAFNTQKKIFYFLECKMLKHSVDPRSYSEDYQKFFAKNGYFYKFKNKVEYFKANKKLIIQYLFKKLKIEDEKIEFSFEYKIITFYPSITQYLPKSFNSEIGFTTLYDLKKKIKEF